MMEICIISYFIEKTETLFLQTFDLLHRSSVIFHLKDSNLKTVNITEISAR